MPRVLGIHGIAQQYTSGPETTAVWWQALRGGLEIAGSREAADNLTEADVRVAFFGDLFRPDGAMPGGDPPYTSADVKTGPERDLLAIWYAAAVDQEPSLGPPEDALGPGKVAVQVMLERLLHSKVFALVAARTLIGDIKQATKFLGDPDIKERVLQRVSDEVLPDTKIIVGHSLGSIVAYEFLARFAPPQVDLLVTLGSPLGIPNLIFERLTPTPVDSVGAWPGTVSRWVNIADKNDFVALRKQLAPLFKAENGVRVEDHLVDNGDDPHGITRHLNAKVTGNALRAVL